MNRRDFLIKSAISSGIALYPSKLYPNQIHDSKHKIACQQYTWFSYFRREGKKWMENPADSLKTFTASGLTGYEPSFESPGEIAVLQKELEIKKIWSKSMYVNSVLHEPELVEDNISNILNIAQEAKKIGISILVTNPTPISWGGVENKTDAQLKAQALALNLLGKKLRSIGMTLAYHNHDAEMREGAREFHHMLTGTDPDNVKLCLDAHWIYRGSGNSQVALFDIVDIYVDRIVELHLRQSHAGLWSEVFEKGDIDYARLASVLKQGNLRPLLVLEQAVEEGTPHTMSTEEAMSKSLENVVKTFKALIQ